MPPSLSHGGQSCHPYTCVRAVGAVCLDPSRISVRGKGTLYRLHDNSRSVGKNFRNPSSNFGRVIAQADHRVATQFCCVLEHQIKCVVAGLFAQLRIQGYVAPEERLNSGADISHNRPRANDDAARNAKASCHAEVREIESSRDQRMLYALVRHTSTIHWVSVPANATRLQRSDQSGNATLWFGGHCVEAIIAAGKREPHVRKRNRVGWIRAARNLGKPFDVGIAATAPQLVAIRTHG
jgi:hypothetical protein